MIFVDNIGSSWPVLDHSPWNGVALADFVMPFFDFILGVSLVFSLKSFHKQLHLNQNNAKNRRKAKYQTFKKVSKRFVKLFVIGILTQGGIDIANYDMKHIRIMGILQRVALCYYFASILEIFVAPIAKHSPKHLLRQKARQQSATNDSSRNPTNSHYMSNNSNIMDATDQAQASAQRLLTIANNKNRQQSGDEIVQNGNISARITSSNMMTKLETKERVLMSFQSLFGMYAWHYVAFFLMVLIYHFLVYFVQVPDQYREKCGAGVITPACNVAGWIDKQLFSVDHMYFPTNGGSFDDADVTFQRLPACSSCSPGKCQKDDKPYWCNHVCVCVFACLFSREFGIFECI